MIKCAVLTAGGEGRRMKESGAMQPKPFVKVHGKCLISYIIDSLVANGINEIIIIEPYFYSLKKELKKIYPNLVFKFYKPRIKQNVIKNLLNIRKLVHGNFIMADTDIIINENTMRTFINNYKNIDCFASIATVINPIFENNCYFEIENNIIKSFNKNGIIDGVHGGFLYTFNKGIFNYLKKYEKTNNPSFSAFINYLIKFELVYANYIDDIWDVDNLVDKEKTENILKKMN